MTDEQKQQQLLQEMAPNVHTQELSDAEIVSLKKDREAMRSLDKIEYPLECVLYGAQKWTYRNDAYRKWLVKMDVEAKERFDKIIKEKRRL